MNLATLFPLLLAVHVALAVALFVPSLLLPFRLGGRRRSSEPPGRLTRALLSLQASGSLVVGSGLAVTGVALLVVLGPQLLVQPWLLLALGLYALNLGLAYFVQRPGLRQLVGLSGDSSDEARERWRRRARRQRYVSYLMAGGVGLIAFLMSTKPGS